MLVRLYPSKIRHLCGIKHVLHCSTMPMDINPYDYKSKFTLEEETKLLEIINTSNQDQLTGYIPQTKLRKIQSYKAKRGPFRAIGEVLEVEGLSINLLDKFCTTLLTSFQESNSIAADQLVPKSTCNANWRKVKSFVTPSVTVENVNSAVAVHLTPIGASWAHLTVATNEVTNWQCKCFEAMPKRLLPHETFALAADLLTSIPAGDVYVFEGDTSVTSGPTQSLATNVYAQHVELTSMLYAQLRTSPMHNELDAIETHMNSIHFLRHKLPARLFKLLVGNERISTQATVMQIMAGEPIHTGLPHTPLHINATDKLQYHEKPSHLQELLGQGLLQLSTFHDLCIVKNMECINFVSRKAR